MTIGRVKQLSGKQPAPPGTSRGWCSRRGSELRSSRRLLPRVPIVVCAGWHRRCALHDLRHTCASMLLAQNVPPRAVMEILGHSSLDVTMNIYGHVMLDAQRDALKVWTGCSEAPLPSK